MRFGPVSLDEAVGKILAHNVSDPDGRRRLRKGIRVDAGTIATLRELGIERVYVAEPEPDDIHEDEAADRVALVVAGTGTRTSRSHTGRVNVTAEAAGVLRVRVESLDRVNRNEGITVATLRTHSVVGAGERVATVKVIPYALPWETVERAEALAPAGPIVEVRPIVPRRVAVVLVGSAGAKEALREGLGEAIRTRLARWGCPCDEPVHSLPDEAALGQALRRRAEAGAEVLVVAGETAIMDVDDVIPRGIRAAGGRVEHLGLPMDPGHLLLLAYLGTIPVVGAPGCVRGAVPDGFDAVFPRVLTGERLTGSDLQALGHGGLLSNPRGRESRGEER